LCRRGITSIAAFFRIGYVYETSADDFERARTEYARVKDEYGSSPFTSQAAQRVADLAVPGSELDRIVPAAGVNHDAPDPRPLPVQRDGIVTAARSGTG
jgi:hypothetical protein